MGTLRSGVRVKTGKAARPRRLERFCMRVIAGRAKGTRLYCAGGRRVRPVLDRVKESLFSLLSEKVEGTRVLDLFAGSGSLGIEALSRGAAHADFVESHRAAVGALRKNLVRTGLSEQARVYTAWLPGALSLVRGPYGLIFVDPPFRIDERLLEGVFRGIRARHLLESDGLVIYRHSPRLRFELKDRGWSLEDRRDYGDSVLSLYRLEEDGGGKV